MKNKCSLKDTKILRDLILENPELPVLIFCSEGVWDGEHAYTQAYASKGEIDELTLYGDMWLDEEDYKEKLADDLGYEKEYENMSEEEYSEMIDGLVSATEFVKAIVLWVG